LNTLTYKHFNLEVSSVKNASQRIFEKSNKDFISTNGFFILNKKDVYSSIYTTRIKSLSLNDKSALYSLSLLDIQIDSIIGQYKDKPVLLIR